MLYRGRKLHFDLTDGFALTTIICGVNAEIADQPDKGFLGGTPSHVGRSQKYGITVTTIDGLHIRFEETGAWHDNRSPLQLTRKFLASTYWRPESRVLSDPTAFEEPHITDVSLTVIIDVSDCGQLISVSEAITQERLRLCYGAVRLL